MHCYRFRRSPSAALQREADMLLKVYVLALTLRDLAENNAAVRAEELRTMCIGTYRQVAATVRSALDKRVQTSIVYFIETPDGRRSYHVFQSKAKPGDARNDPVRLNARLLAMQDTYTAHTFRADVRCMCLRWFVVLCVAAGRFTCRTVQS